jgi:hypothetical protein
MHPVVQPPACGAFTFKRSQLLCCRVDCPADFVPQLSDHKYGYKWFDVIFQRIFVLEIGKLKKVVDILTF